MVEGNPFRHQTYAATRPTAPHRLLSPPACPPVGSDEFRRRMRHVGTTLRRSGVVRVYLAHGTLVGIDALGVLSELARSFPSAGKAVQGVIKRIVDKVAGEAGNYTPSYARCFESSMHRSGRQRIPVQLFHWSSENHHLGRADAAVRLIAELASLKLKPSQRVLLWGHSHAGNVFALTTHLLAGNRQAVDRFFEAAEIYYRWPVVGCVDVPIWKQVRDLLRGESQPFAGASLDLVTFGTPIRYGWDPNGYSRLLHFVNHRPRAGLPKYRAKFPPKLEDILDGADGDYVQQLGIAGTNVTPSLFSWRAWMADSRLNRLLQGDSLPQKTLERFKAGAIVPDQGTTLLVDYGRPEGTIAQHHAGHAVYTGKRWLLFHAEEVVRRFYEEDPSAA